MSDILINALVGAIAAAILFIGTYFSTKGADEGAIPDWKMIASYGLVGLVLGGAAGYAGIVITYEWVGIQVVAYMGVIKLVDMVLVSIWPTPLATYIMKYSGRSFYPIFIVTQKDGTVQTYNTEATGRSCQITVYRDASVARAIGQKLLATVGWSTGFTVSPSFIDGVASVGAVLKIKVGRNSDSSTIDQIVVKPGDGSADEIVKLALNSEGTSEGVYKHTYKFY